MEKIINYQLIDNKIIKFNFTDNNTNESSEQDGGWGKSAETKFWEIDEEIDELFERIDDGEELKDPDDLMYLLEEISVVIIKFKKLMTSQKRSSKLTNIIQDDAPYFYKKLKKFLKSFKKIIKSKGGKVAIKKLPKKIQRGIKIATKFRLPATWKVNLALKFM